VFLRDVLLSIKKGVLCESDKIFQAVPRVLPDVICEGTQRRLVDRTTVEFERLVYCVMMMVSVR